jgi:hypothetical protein
MSIIYYDERYGQMDRAHFGCTLSVCLMDLKRSNKTTIYITNTGEKSPRIPYNGQRLWPWNMFKRLCVIPLLRSGLCDGRSAVTSLEHNRTDITQHFSALCDQTAAHPNAHPHHLVNTVKTDLLLCVYRPDCICFFLSPNNDS